MQDPRTQEAIALMTDFAERTGLDSQRPGKRYLWTDAFAVRNFLGLARTTGDDRYLGLASRLVAQVHHTLGRHREDDPRSGWISGLNEPEGEAHPTRGGLRIGKELPERGPDEPFDERLEWDRDGQYFHYLTQWMHALDELARATGRTDLNLWARELAATAHRAFTIRSSAAGPARMYWKMSIDLRRPLVPSMGQHDPLDGYITYVQLRSTAASLPVPTPGPGLDEEIRDFAAMFETGDWATTDPLGLGSLLTGAYRVDQLIAEGALSDHELLDRLLTSALAGLQYYAGGGELRLPAEYRLGFRELGLAIGLQAVERMWRTAERDPEHFSMHPKIRDRLRTLLQYAPIGDAIETFWRDPVHQRASTWAEHRDINEVMLATRLAPDGVLVLAPLRSPP